MPMTYDEIVDKVRTAYENADARDIFEHIAVQVNIIGEGEGTFYLEVADRHITVEPYEYYDRDALLIMSADTIFAIADGKTTFHDAYHSGALQCYGNMDKMRKLQKIVFGPRVVKRKTTMKRDLFLDE